MCVESLNAKLYKQLQQLDNNGLLRSIPSINGYGKYINGLLNLSSNDYLGLLQRDDLRLDFYSTNKDLKLSSASSRLLTGNCSSYNKLEDLLANMFNKQAALVFNSGYHANTGILPALCQKDTLIIADKLIHASIIDGIKLSGCNFERYKHNDYNHLNKIISKEGSKYNYIFIVTESIFSMDGDVANLKELVKIKKNNPKVILYVDEAHAFGAVGEKGLGVCECEDVIDDFDIIVGTFGKAISSMGAFVVCNKIIRDYLVNKMRPLIFSTTLPQINIEWTYYILQRLKDFAPEREHLSCISKYLKEQFNDNNPSMSHIIPYITADAQKALQLTQELKNGGFYALSVRPPTVPPNGSRVRFSLTAQISMEEIKSLANFILQTKQKQDAAI